MITIPAIDIHNGKVVRLTQGKFEHVKVYSDDPVNVAFGFEMDGAKLIHVVDLDGAKNQKVTNWDKIIRMARMIKIPIEVGGGVRTSDDLKRLFSSGIKRVVLGTKAIEDKEFLKNALKEWGKNIIVSLDCSNGFITQKGWTEATQVKPIDLIKELEPLGMSQIIYTDISRDGMLKGPNVDSLKEILSSTKISVIASGGISTLDDIRQLVAIKNPRLFGVIVGKALYEKRFTLKEAIDLCSPKG